MLATAPPASAGGAVRASGLPSGRTDYRELADYSAEIAELAAEHPADVRRVVIGASVQGRPLEGLEIAQDVARTDDGRPVHVEVGLIHAREWPSGEMVMEFAHELATGGGRFATLRSGSRTFLFPVANPDGYAMSRESDPLLRTNANGVDLNRNAGAFWGGPDSSVDPRSTRYRGPAPFSEPEAEALHAFSAGRQVAVIDVLHTYGGSVLYQPGFTRSDEPGLPAGTRVPGTPRFKRLARRMAAAAGYTAAPAWDPRDITGATEDWNYFTQFATAFTIEVGYEDFHPDYASGVVAQYPGVRDALLLAGEAALDRHTHAVLQGTAPPGRTLRLGRSVRTRTSYVITHTERPSAVTGRSQVVHDRLSSRLTVPASGHFVWHVNPSVRPLDVLARRRPAWTLRCGSGARRVVLRVRDQRTLRLRCGG
ncbi:MAG: carboxypeptidase [Solirubrobacteraceae bacterium]|nr:carboxypeptidase [Solirubrobacteraceae bacterium]